MRLTAETDVLAPLERVWSLTEDLEALPTVTPTMTSVERLDDGPLRTGSRARVLQPRQRPAVWRVRSVEAPHELVWEATTSGVRMVAGHHLSEVEGGTRNLLVLDVLDGGAVLGRLAAPLLRRALATENDGFRRAAEDLERPAYVDEHAVELPVPPRRAWAAVRGFVDDLLARGEESRLTGLLATDPPAGFAVAAEQPPHLLSLAGRHRFSDYVLDLRVAPRGDGARVTAVTYADFPGARGRAYRAAVIGSRGHVVAVRRILSAIGERA
ncbi:SRPBCC family protein [Nocardioides sp. GXQ0305]|uniref:SRPBCC family protein n=1 Tax=Nocardioides sp. GXQ0305 TaxID=3423912 RepID=UPI003D7CBD5C